ncbi:MAG: HlyD family efflux transporter periplasmic adaptor subunit, partial [Planctomicrobium sp.]|nr:HlyD family efflux transporter periplasmic adaptor subunit [Planctomicrobium sp.]
GVTYYVFGQKPEIETIDESHLNQGVLIETVQVGTYSGPVDVSVDGEATTYRVVEVGAEVAGQIEYKSDKSRSGHYVKKGELLFKIDDENYQIAVDSQKAQLEQIDEEIRSLNVDLDNLSTLVTLANEELKLQQEYLTRTQNLFERNATTETELDNAETKELAARNGLQKLKNESSSKRQSQKTEAARLKVAEVALRRAQADLNRCTVVASITGRIVDDNIEEGNFVAAGQLLTKITDASLMEIRCQLQPSEVAWIWEQQIVQRSNIAASQSKNEDPIDLIPVPCEVVFEFGGIETIWDGVLTRFAGTGVSRDTRTFPARVLVKNPEQTRTQTKSGAAVTISPPTLLSGMFVEVRIPVTPAQPLLSLPVEAIRPGGKVWVADQESKLRIVDVTVARVVGDQSLIRPTTQLSEGDKVILSPISAVIEGMPVREFEDEQQATVEQNSSEETAKEKA